MQNSGLFKKILKFIFGRKTRSVNMGGAERDTQNLNQFLFQLMFLLSKDS